MQDNKVIDINILSNEYEELKNCINSFDDILKKMNTEISKIGTSGTYTGITTSVITNLSNNTIKTSELYRETLNNGLQDLKNQIDKVRSGIDTLKQ